MYLNWGRAAEIIGNKVAGLERHVEAPDDAEPSHTEVATPERPSQDARVARKETTDEATDVSLEHWGRGAELVGDQVTRLGGCQVGQFNCLGQAPEWDTADSSCEVCYNHFDSCLKKRLVVWCQGEMKGYDDMRCLGEVCQFDTDTGPWSFNDGHWVQDTESNCAEVAWMLV